MHNALVKRNVKLFQSMTGFGSARTVHESVTIVTEIKSVNNRFLKTSIRLPELYLPLESKVEQLVRDSISRGSVWVSVRVIQSNQQGTKSINLAVLKGYLDSLTQFDRQFRSTDGKPSWQPVSVGDCLRLPGVIEESEQATDDDFYSEFWVNLESNLRQALVQLAVMRRQEGEAMAVSLREQLELLRELIATIQTQSPIVVELYRNRLSESISKMLAEKNLTFDPAGIIREVALFADKSDISEEVVRFYSHLEQFDKAMGQEEPCGRKLDFLVQEMFREVNTIGSKGNNTAIIGHVVEMKTIMERVREMIQNVE